MDQRDGVGVEPQGLKPHVLRIGAAPFDFAQGKLKAEVVPFPFVVFPILRPYLIRTCKSYELANPSVDAWSRGRWPLALRRIRSLGHCYFHFV